MAQNYYPPPGGYGPPPGGGGYGPPPGPPPGFPPAGPPGGGGGSAEGQVTAPAIGLIVTAIIGVLWQIAALLMNLLGTGLGVMGAAGGAEGGVGTIFSGVIGMALNVIQLLMGGIVLFGGIKMKSLQSYGLAMAGAVLAAIPCTSPCCFLGLPIGIWAIVVLMNQQVKSAFR